MVVGERIRHVELFHWLLGSVSAGAYIRFRTMHGNGWLQQQPALFPTSVWLVLVLEQTEICRGDVLLPESRLNITSQQNKKIYSTDQPHSICILHAPHTTTANNNPPTTPPPPPNYPIFRPRSPSLYI